MIEDLDLDLLLRQFAGELAEIASWPDGSLFGRDIYDAVFEKVEYSALLMARVYAGLDGRMLREKLAEAGVLKIGAQDEMVAAIDGFFDYYARLLVAFASAAPRAKPPMLTIAVAQRPVLRERDTIFERRGPKIGERSGGLDLSPGQPTSTAQYPPEIPTWFYHPVNQEAETLAARMRAAGLAPLQDDVDALADDVRARLGPAPAVDAPFEKRRVAFPDDGKEIVGTVFIQRPAVLSAAAPALLRADASDPGPQVSSPPSPPPRGGED